MAGEHVRKRMSLLESIKQNKKNLSESRGKGLKESSGGSFEDWERTAQVKYSEQPSRDTNRDIYVIDGVDVYDHTVVPYNVFKPSYKYTVLGLQFPETPENKEILKSFGGYLNADWYCPEGYKMPFFDEDDGKDPLEKAWNFIKQYKRTGLVDAEDNLTESTDKNKYEYQLQSRWRKRNEPPNAKSMDDLYTPWVDEDFGTAELMISPEDVQKMFAGEVVSLDNSQWRAVKKTGSVKESASPLDQIKKGDKVTIVDKSGNKRTGKAVMRNRKIGAWVLNMGGKHGTPGLADSSNVVAVNGKKTLLESSEGYPEIWNVYYNGEMFYTSRSTGFEHDRPVAKYFSEEEAEEAASKWNAKRDSSKGITESSESEIAGEREALEQKYGQVWDNRELQNDFQVVSFAAPFVVVRRKSDGKEGTMSFQHMPRLYYDFR